MAGFESETTEDTTEVKTAEPKEEKKPLRCHMLLTKNLEPVPATIKTLDNWGNLMIIVGKDPNNKVFGKHVFLEGDIDDLQTWLKDKKVWMGKGHPQWQEFEEIGY
jgi:hypothetical protein